MAFGWDGAVPDPDPVPEAGKVWRGFAGLVPYPRFTAVQPDARCCKEMVGQQVIDGPDSVGWGNGVYIIQECGQGFPWLQLGLYGLERRPLRQGDEDGHEIALFAPLCLCHCVRLVVLVVPHIFRWSSIPKACKQALACVAVALAACWCGRLCHTRRHHRSTKWRWLGRFG